MPQNEPMSAPPGSVAHDEIVAAGRPWGRLIARGQTLRIIDLHGQQAVDFLCFDAANPADRYSAANTLKVRQSAYIEPGIVLYSDAGHALFTLTADTMGRHDTIYGCCSNANNRLRYGAGPGPNCYDNFREILATFGLGDSAIVSNINFFMQVPIGPDGRIAVASGVSAPGNYVDLRAERDVLAVLSNCPQIHNPCNGFDPTPVRVIITRA